MQEGEIDTSMPDINLDWKDEANEEPVAEKMGEQVIYSHFHNMYSTWPHTSFLHLPPNKTLIEPYKGFAGLGEVHGQPPPTDFANAENDH